MNRAELVEKVALENGMSKAATDQVLKSFLEAIKTTVKKGGSVGLIGFGTFKQVARAARVGKNPQTGAALKIPAAKVPKFVPGAQFKATVDPKAAARKAAKKTPK